jgi:hypothetical protein
MFILCSFSLAPARIELSLLLPCFGAQFSLVSSRGSRSDVRGSDVDLLAMQGTAAALL